MKGQKSLEMIIGLVMLLVVASVTISMFLNVFEEPNLGDETVEKQEIQKECSSSCNQFREASGRQQLSAALDYCTKKFTRDVNQDGTTSEVAGAGYNSYCEDGIKCFNIHTCETGINEELDAQKCRQLMCEYYTKVNKDPYDKSAEDNVHDHIQDVMSPQNEETGVGTCDLSNAQDSAGYEISTWYNPRNTEYSFTGGEDGETVCEPEYSNYGSGGLTEAQQFCRDAATGAAANFLTGNLQAECIPGDQVPSSGATFNSSEYDRVAEICEVEAGDEPRMIVCET